MNEGNSRMNKWVNPGTVLGMVAVIISLTGTAFAAGLIDGGDIKNSSVTGKDVKNKSLTTADFKGSVQGPQGPQGPQGERGAAGTPGTPGADGSALAYAHIKFDGTMVAADSKNIANFQKSTSGPGNFCFDVSVPVHNAVATLENFSDGQISIFQGDPIPYCSGATYDFTVTTKNSTGSDVAGNGFWVLFN